MGLFDNLFKNRPEDAVERIVEAPLKASLQAERAGAERSGDSPDPEAVFLQPKGYADPAGGTVVGGQNQGFVPVLPGPRRSAPGARRAESAAAAPGGNGEVILCVGDVLPRIPVGLLRPGPHDLKHPLRFRVEHLSSDIARGKPGIALSVIADQCPELFAGPITDDDDMEVRLPLQKIVEQVSRFRALPPAAAQQAAAPAQPARHLQPPPPPRVLPPPAPVAVVPAPPATTPPPPPVPEPPPAEPEAPVAEVATPEPRLAEPPVMEPAVVLPPIAPAPPPVAAAPLAPPPTAEEPAEPTAPAAPLPQKIAVEPEIDLSLSAVVAAVPRELLAGQRPLIDESCRVRLPFPIIERQLGTGRVSIPASILWDALPPLLRHHFIVRDDVLVPVPLEEIFQNLPVGLEARRDPLLAEAIAGERNSDPAIVLAPAPAREATPELGPDLPWESGLRHSAPADNPPPEPVAETPATPAPPMAAEVPAEAAASEPPAAAPSEPERASEISASAPPDEDQPPLVHLQPFRIVAQQSPAIGPVVAASPDAPEPIVLGLAPVASDVAVPPNILKPAAPDGEMASGGENGGDERAEVAQRSQADRPREEPVPFAERPEFASIVPPEPDTDPLAAFTPEEPPPVTIAEPAAAVAVLRSTVPVPETSPVFASASVSVQAPKIFRPMVLAPPVSGQAPSGGIHLAPTLAGAAPAGPGLISLAPSAAPAEPLPAGTPAVATPPAPPAAAAHPEPAPEPAAATPPAPAPPEPVRRESKPTLRELSRRLFSPSSLPPQPADPPPAKAAEVPPAAPELPPVFTPVPAVANLHLQIPPLPAAPPSGPAPHDPAVPALPLSRFDQHSLQSLFMTDETLDLPKIVRLAAALPGIQACVIATRGDTFTGGVLPPGFEIATLRGLAPQVGAAADRLPIGELKNFTLYGDQFSVSFFERVSVCLCAIHRARAFVPGVREKLAAVADELAREG